MCVRCLVKASLKQKITREINNVTSETASEKRFSLVNLDETEENWFYFSFR